MNVKTIYFTQNIYEISVAISASWSLTIFQNIATKSIWLFVIGKKVYIIIFLLECQNNFCLDFFHSLLKMCMRYQLWYRPADVRQSFKILEPKVSKVNWERLRQMCADVNLSGVGAEIYKWKQSSLTMQINTNLAIGNQVMVKWYCWLSLSLYYKLQWA